MNGTADNQTALLQEILKGLHSLKQEHSQLAATVDAIGGRVNVLAGVKQTKEAAAEDRERSKPALQPTSHTINASLGNASGPQSISPPPPENGRRPSITSKIILTSYPGQAGVDPLPMNWGAKDPAIRGPVVVSRNPNTIRRRNGR